MTGNNKVWRAPLAGLASLAMIATMGVTALSANAVTYSPDNDVMGVPAFTVTFDAGSRGKIGYLGTKQTADFPSNTGNGYKVAAPYVDVNDDANYVFTGWYTAPTGGDRVEFDTPANTDTPGDAASESMSTNAITKDVTLYAHYANKKTQGDLVKVSFGNDTKKYTNPGVSGYTVWLAAGDKLADWQKPSDKVDGVILSWPDALNGAFTANKTIDATHTQGVKVTFGGVYGNWDFLKDSKGVYATSSETGEKTATYETTVGGALDAAPVIYNASNTSDYRVTDAWVESDGTPYVPGTTTVSKDTTVVGKSDTAAYKVVFKVNDLGGDLTGAAGNSYAFGNPADAYVAADSAIALPDLNLYDGLYSVKWYYKQTTDAGTSWHEYNGQTAEAVKLSNENQTDPSLLTNHALTLHAVLSPAASQQYTVTFDENYGNGAQTKVTVAKGATVAVPATPVRDGYRFLGWYDAANGGSKFDFNTPIDSFTKINATNTLYAHWQLTAQYDLDTLLALTNDKGLYTDNSYDTYEKVRAGIAGASEGAITGNKTAGYKADYANDYLTDAKVTELTKTLQTAYEKLVYKTDVRAAFTDVDALTPHARNIWNLTAQGVIKGFNNGDGTYSFGGTKTILRQDFAAFLYRLAGEPEFDVANATKTFSDVNASTPHYKEILWAASNGVLNGFSDGTFRGTQTILRQDAAAMLYNLVKGKNIDPTFDPAAEPQFTDVNASTPHYTAIMFLAKYGVIRGFSDGSFGGTKTILRQDAAAFLDRLQNNKLGPNYTKVDFAKLYK
ncbi:S-layer homology domain-containing protein [Bifidobacterium miconisargentati]|uniref:S-layer homology domain-containing protein n=1 Tax=Bifidobacterium miconisargentati TaxID=2834437 RepID=UPI001BDC2B2B|nr:S-layer homology domain-containing protein [Bifidobacterium miconisargentati]MBW3091140.1 S-layer homology domain-containing protein [Bifidobacterium miconisargentati]